MDKKRIAAVVVTYNRLYLLKRCLKCLRMLWRMNTIKQRESAISHFAIVHFLDSSLENGWPVGGVQNGVL